MERPEGEQASRMPTGIIPLSSFQPGRGSRPPRRCARGEAQARSGLRSEGSGRRTSEAPQAHQGDKRMAADARPPRAPEGGETMPAPPGQFRPHAPARWTWAAPPRGEGQRREGARSGGPQDLAPPAAPRAPHARRSRGRTPTSSSSGPLGPVPLPAPVQCSTSGFRLLMVRGTRRGERDAPSRGGQGQGEPCAPEASASW